MIYENEFRNYIVNKFNDNNIIYNKDEKTENLLIYYIDFILRSFINRTKFEICYSREIVDKIKKNIITISEKDSIELIETELKNAKNIREFLSKKVFKYNYPKNVSHNEKYIKGDNLFGNWMISHFHLKDSNNLLFVKLGKSLEEVFFLDILKHPNDDDWYQDYLLEIIDKNWDSELTYMDKIFPFVGRVKNIINDHAENEVQQKSKNQFILRMINGKCVMPYGSATSQDSLFCIDKYRTLLGTLNEFKSKNSKSTIHFVNCKDDTYIVVVINHCVYCNISTKQLLGFWL